MSNKRLVEFPQNAGKQLQRFERGSNYDLAEAIGEFIDNSIDWGGKKISIDLLTRRGNGIIIIADDGVGMTEETLLEAASLGSRADENLTRAIDKDDQIGVYGVGMKEAAYGLAETITIVSKHKDAPICELVIDKSKMRETDKFCGEIMSNDENSQKLFDKYLKSKTGTVICLAGCYNHNTKRNKDILVSELSRIYRKFLVEKISIVVNGTKLKPMDPLYWDADDTTTYGPFVTPIYNRRTVHSSGLDTSSVNEKIGEVTVRLTLLGDTTMKKLSPKDISENRGISLLRGKREICRNIFGEFIKGCDKYSVRGEIITTPSLDKYISPSGNKNKVRIHECIQDQLAIAFKQWSKDIEEEIERRSAASRNQKIQSLLDKLSEKLSQAILGLDIPGSAGPGQKVDDGVIWGAKKKKGPDGTGGPDGPGGDPTPSGNGVKVLAKKDRYDTTGKGDKSYKLNIQQKSLGEQSPHMNHSIGDKGQLEIIFNQDNPVYKQVSEESGPVQEAYFSVWIAHAITIIKAEMEADVSDGYSAIDQCMRQFISAKRAA
jgi:hypothetical protein